LHITVGVALARPVISARRPQLQSRHRSRARPLRVYFVLTMRLFMIYYLHDCKERGTDMSEVTLTYEEILADPANTGCLCLDESEGAPFCPLRGKCKECIAHHRYYAGSPHCLRAFTLKPSTPPTPETRRTHDEILGDPANLICKCSAETCGDPDCSLKGNCRDCIAIHRYFKGLPACIRASAGVTESVVP